VEKNGIQMNIGRYGTALGLSGKLRSAMKVGRLAPTVAFLLTIAYVVLEYARPQDTIGFLKVLKLSLIVSGMLAFFLWRQSRRVPWFRPQIVLLTVIVGYMTLWVPFATNNYWALKNLLVFLQTYIFVLSFVTFVDSEPRLRHFFMVFIAAGLFQAAWGIWHGGTGTGYFQADENDFALSMCMILPFTLMMMSVVKGWWARSLCWVTGLMCVAAVVVSNSRGGFVGLVITSGMMVLMHRQRFRFAVAGAIGAVVLAFAAPSSYWDEMRTITDEGGTRQDRIELWEIAAEVYRDNPIFGVGPGNINWVLNDYQDYDSETRMFGGRAVHSLYYTLLPELGTVGTLLFLGVLYFGGRDIGRVIRARRRETDVPLDAYARATACSITAYLVCGIFLSVLWYPHFYVLTAIALAVMRVQEVQSAEALDARVDEVVAEDEPEGIVSPA